MADNTDIGAEDRKRDHIDLAFKSKVSIHDNDTRFNYEPLLAPHPDKNTDISVFFLGRVFKAPIWASSMTGGTVLAGIINKNLAKACGQFGLGMGLGSCRQLLYDHKHFDDFDVRKYMGSQPLYANLGIAQLEELIEKRQLQKVDDLLKKLQADGLIVHINPMQEWLQPEGDRFLTPPLDTITRLLDELNWPIIVKEVGQGFGPKSIQTLLQLPLAAIDFGAFGGTNFALLETLRSSISTAKNYIGLTKIGHTALEMVSFVNRIIDEGHTNIKCKEVIISGGIHDFLDGFYLINKLKLPSVYGQASGLLANAKGDYAHLENYIQVQIEGLKIAKSMLNIK